MNVTMLLTFRLLGFGWDGGGILLESPLQSQKLIAVWTELKPLPLVVRSPAPIILGFVLFGEPLHLIAIELIFWACIALSEGLVIAAIIGKKAPDNALGV